MARGLGVAVAVSWCAGVAVGAASCPCEDCSDPRLANASSWALYRLSDVFAHTLSNYDACFWPRSIACDYARTRSRLSDMEAFLGAVRRAERGRRVPSRVPGDKEVVWHLRLGDTVNCSEAFLRPCSRNAKYVLQRSYFEAVVAALPEAARTVTLVYALGHEACKGRADPRHAANSRRYVADARAFLEARGYDVAERADLLPDDDMIFLCNAKILVLSGGGYTRLAGECALAYGASRGAPASAPAAVFGLQAPATRLVALPKADRRARDAALAAEKERRGAKKARAAERGQGAAVR